jgi:hypothetical protein
MDLLAAFMEDDEVPESQHQDDFVFVSEGEQVTENEVEQSLPMIPEETIAELLEVLVKQELKQRENRGEEWLSELPAHARADIQSAKVIKDQDAYQLSLIIDMGGSGAVRPLQQSSLLKMVSSQIALHHQFQQFGSPCTMY